MSIPIKENFPSNPKVLVTPTGEVYLTGGIIGGAVTNIVKKIDLNQKLCIDLPARMVNARQNHAVIYFSNQMFVFGGVNQSGADISQCERLDLQTYKGWVPFKPLMSAQSQFNVTAFRNKFIVKSGISSG